MPSQPFSTPPVLPLSAPPEPPFGSPTPRRGGAAWQAVLRDAVRDVRELCRLLELPASLADEGAEAVKAFELLVPQGYLARMKKGDLSDPLLRQVLPLGQETQRVPGFVPDPVADRAAEVVPGLLQKYHGRALLVTTGTCAVHCRYCFRRQFPYEEAPKSLRAWEPAIDAIQSDPTIREVILSGGDPLTLADRRLAALTGQIAAIDHVTRLRVHSRLPILIPERVTDGLVKWLRGTRLTPLLVIHANHAQEIDGQVARAVSRLVDAGVPVLNQAVLLAGVNDSVDAQAALWERLIDIRVLPYYLHRLDRVAGAAHFDVPIEKGRAIVEMLRNRLPGYAVPRFVEEVPTAGSKAPL